jgi:hypothetical protein
VLDISYHYVAVDTNGNPIDTDGDGISDYIEDSNGDGVYDAGDLSDWTDYYNGVLPLLSISGGNNQAGMPGGFLPQPLTVGVTGSSGAVLGNAPLTFSASAGGAQLAAAPGGATSPSMIARSDTSGLAWAYLLLPGAFDTNCSVSAAAWSGTNSVKVTFTENTMGSAKVWLRADTGVSSNSINQLTTWADQTTNHNDAAAYILEPNPVLVANVLNGKPVLRFDGTRVYLRLNPNTCLTGLTRAAEAFIVLRAATNINATYGLWTLTKQTDPYYASYYPDSGTGQIMDSFGSTFGRVMGVPLLRIDQFHVYNPASAVGQWTARLNGKLQYSDNINAPVAFSDQPYIGYNSGEYSPWFKGDMAEILIFGRVLSDAERDAVGFYLNNKYALVSVAGPVPSALSATGVAPGVMNLSWTYTPPANAVTFAVERRVGTSGCYAQIGSSWNTNSYLDRTAVPGTNYFYRVRGWDYNGYSGYAAAVSPPAILITNPASPAVFSYGTNLTARAAATDLGGSVTNVLFLANALPIATNTSVPYSATLTNPATAYYSLTAKATDNQGNSAYSARVGVIVSPNTDGDGGNDFNEVLLGLDPTNSGDGGGIPPAPNPGDHTPPTIFLDEPTNATLL